MRIDGKDKGFKVLIAAICMLLLVGCSCSVSTDVSTAATEAEKASKFSEIESENLKRAKIDYLTGETVKKTEAKEEEGEYFVIDYGDVTYVDWEVLNTTYRMFKIPGRNIECMADFNGDTLQCWNLKTKEDGTLDTVELDVQVDSQIPGW